MPSFLLEIFSEEIPARMQADAQAHLQAALEKALGAKAKMFVTPRRLAAIIDELPEKQPDISEELKGPKVGAPDAAMQGFLKKTGLTKEQLVEKDGVYFAKIEQKGKATSDVLKEVVEKIMAEFPWPKSMRWGRGETSWVRPLHSILCIFDCKVVPVEYAGVKAGNTTRGHRFLAPGAITVTQPEEYEAQLAKVHVVADRETRKTLIAQQLSGKCRELGVTLHDDERLLEEVTGLVEWPNVLSGTIDASYMDLPEEVLILEMKNHQKYFATRDASGKLSAHFLITSNMVIKEEKVISAGNERVLRARFADGRFFYDQDRKTTLEDWAKKLSDVTYHAKLGSVADKVARVATLAEMLAETLKADKTKVKLASLLCKADLTTGMVGEFPELQGVMGRYYANHEKLDAAVADAIRDHYKPQGPSDSVPTAPVSICMALAEKLDTLISMFAIGEKPTGSKDPFALRRAAIGVIRVILENKLRLPLTPLFMNAPLKYIATQKAHEQLVKETEAQLEHPRKIGKYLTVNETACSDIVEGTAERIAAELLCFFHDRLKVQLKEEGIRHDVIAAVVAGGDDAKKDDDLVRIVEKAKALQSFLASDDGTNLLAGYKRAVNILSIEQKKDAKTYEATGLQLSLLKETEEVTLADTLARHAGEVEKHLAAEHYIETMKILAQLRGPIDAFFDRIMVNTGEPEIRANRLCLLAKIRSTLDGVADFTTIEA
jgi:glycyl-tRNA synthetase beta chain